MSTSYIEIETVSVAKRYIFPKWKLWINEKTDYLWPDEISYNWRSIRAFFATVKKLR